MNFQSRDSCSSPLIKSNYIQKLQYITLLEIILFRNKSFISHLPPIFKSWLIFCCDVRNYQTVSLLLTKYLKNYIELILTKTFQSL